MYFLRGGDHMYFFFNIDIFLNFDKLKFNPNGGWIKACKHHDGWDSSVNRIGWVWEEWEQSNVSVHNNLVSHLEKVNLD